MAVSGPTGLGPRQPDPGPDTPATEERPPLRHRSEVKHFDRATEESVVALATTRRRIGTKTSESGAQGEEGRVGLRPGRAVPRSDGAKEAANRFCRDRPWEARLVPRVLPARRPQPLP